MSLYCTIRYVPAGGGEEEGARPGQGEQGGGLHGHWGTVDVQLCTN